VSQVGDLNESRQAVAAAGECVAQHAFQTSTTYGPPADRFSRPDGIDYRLHLLQHTLSKLPRWTRRLWSADKRRVYIARRSCRDPRACRCRVSTASCTLHVKGSYPSKHRRPHDAHGTHPPRRLGGWSRRYMELNFRGIVNSSAKKYRNVCITQRADVVFRSRARSQTCLELGDCWDAGRQGRPRSTRSSNSAKPMP
jgi:hypothetical protein